MDPLLLGTLVFAALALLVTILAIAAFRRQRPVAGSTGALMGLLLLTAGALCATLALATRGFRALTREEVAAVVETRPTGEHRFEATFQFPDGSRRTYHLRGDQVYVDARIVKWEPAVNLLGLHTLYELDRVGGRYRRLAAERDSPRTVYPLGRDRPVEIGGLLDRLPFLRELVDAEYGSATFVEVSRPRTLEVRVGTDGLLIRTVAGDTGPSVPGPGATPGTRRPVPDSLPG